MAMRSTSLQEKLLFSRGKTYSPPIFIVTWGKDGTSVFKEIF